MNKHLPTFILLASTVFAQTAVAQKYAGGDISLLPSYEEHGAKYYTNDGTAISDVLSYFKSQGWNAQRVRIFVDPSKASSTAKGQGVVQDMDYVLKLAKKIKDAGFALMLDFHYSDTWADPGSQWTPDAWKEANDEVLGDSIYKYTKMVLTKLVEEGAIPNFIQTGNEISYGMDWGTSASNAKYCYPSSDAANWTRFENLLKKATAACRETCPAAKIILHTERVSSVKTLQADNAEYAALTNFYNNMKSSGIDYDVIGLSYYPYYHGDLSQLEGAIDKLDGYGKDIMVVEAGYPAQWKINGTKYDYTATYPYTEAGQKAFTDALVSMLNKHDKVKGLFWWWPEANEYGLDWSTNRVTDSWYNATLFNNQTGKAFSAVSSLKDFVGNSTGINDVTGDAKAANNNAWYSIDGRKLNNAPANKGVYICQGKKYMVK